MRYLILLLFIMAVVSCKKSEDKKDIVSKRIDFIINLKKLTGKKSWKEFSKKGNEGTIFYFHDNKTHVFFEDEVVKKHLLLNRKQNEYFTLEKRYDSIPFHMEVQIEFDSIKAQPLLLNHPIEFCSSPEETQKIIPSVNSIEVWSTMVIHEMFHHFQFNNTKFRDYMKYISELGYDNRDLLKIIELDSEFKQEVLSENKLLLKILNTNSNDSISNYITNFLKLRKVRRNRYSKKNIHFTKVEDAFEKMEGSARYIEYQTMLKMKEISNSKKQLTIKNDSLFNNYKDFKNFDISNEEFQYLYTISYDYYYTLGFNLIRVFDKLKIRYQEDIFNSPSKSLTDILTEYKNTIN